VQAVVIKTLAVYNNDNNTGNRNMPASFYIVRSDGNIIMSMDGVSNGGYSFTFIDAPPVDGAYTYSLLMKADGAIDASGTATGASITSLLVKK